MRASLGALAAVALLFGVWTSLRLSAAEHWFRRNTTASVKRAAALDPLNWRYRAWLAELLEHDGEDPAPELEAAARLNPRDSRVWIRRGLAAELAGDTASGEKLLLHAAAIDRLLEPRWTLMNFYYRRGGEEQFRRWAAGAFAMSYGDRSALFELCWRMRPDPAWVRGMLPDAYETRKQFAGFLARKGRADDAAALVMEILPQASASDLSLYLDIVERLLASRAAAPAVRLWNGLSKARLLPYRELDPAGGVSLTNAEFAVAPLGTAFDWRIPGAAGVARVSSPAAIRLSLSGRQPEECELLRQVMPLAAGRRYRLGLLYRTAGIEAPGGIFIRVGGAATADLVSGEWRETALQFTAGAEGIGTLLVEYKRPPGTMRAEGWIELRELKLSIAE